FRRLSFGQNQPVNTAFVSEGHVAAGSTAKEFIPSHRLAAVLAITLFLFLLTPIAQAQNLAIRHARILPIQGAVIENGTILIEKGKIKALGTNVAVPAGTPSLDAGGATVMPGIVDANAHFGLRDTANEQAAEVTPHISILAQIAPLSPDFPHALSYGVTT